MNIQRVPGDPTKPLKHWLAVIELPPLNGRRRRRTFQGQDRKQLTQRVRAFERDLALTNTPKDEAPATNDKRVI